MSYRAYLHAIETKTGQTPQQLLDEAAEHTRGPGHAMALFGVLMNGPTVPEKHVGSTGTHSDGSPILRLGGIAARQS